MIAVRLSAARIVNVLASKEDDSYLDNFDAAASQNGVLLKLATVPLIDSKCVDLCGQPDCGMCSIARGTCGIFGKHLEYFPKRAIFASK
jgi:hypothetical protein